MPQQGVSSPVTLPTGLMLWNFCRTQSGRMITGLCQLNTTEQAIKLGIHPMGSVDKSLTSIEESREFTC